MLAAAVAWGFSEAWLGCSNQDVQFDLVGLLRPRAKWAATPAGHWALQAVEINSGTDRPRGNENEVARESISLVTLSDGPSLTWLEHPSHASENPAAPGRAPSRFELV